MSKGEECRVDQEGGERCVRQEDQWARWVRDQRGVQDRERYVITHLPRTVGLLLIGYNHCGLIVGR